MTIIPSSQHFSVRTAVPPPWWSSWWAIGRRAWRLAWNLVWPVACAGCGEPDVELCRRCRSVIHGPAFYSRPPGWPPGWGAWAASRYRGVAARLLIAWKERGRHDLTPALAEGLAVALRAARIAAQRGAPGGAGRGEWLLVPVPSSRAARRRRGSDLLGDLVRRAARESRRGWVGSPPRVVDALRHTRRVRDQSELGAQARRANLTGALRVRPAVAARLRGRECVVVDDIVTTGTTAAEAARALTSAGALVVGICSLSVTSRHSGVSAGG